MPPACLTGTKAGDGSAYLSKVRLTLVVLDPNAVLCTIIICLVTRHLGDTGVLQEHPQIHNGHAVHRDPISELLLGQLLALPVAGAQPLFIKISCPCALLGYVRWLSLAATMVAHTSKNKAEHVTCPVSAAVVGTSSDAVARLPDLQMLPFAALLLCWSQLHSPAPHLERNPLLASSM